MSYSVVFVNGLPSVFGPSGAVPNSYVLEVNFPTRTDPAIGGGVTHIVGPGSATIVVGGVTHYDVPLT
jgi:hypothetical protein